MTLRGDSPGPADAMMAMPPNSSVFRNVISKRQNMKEQILNVLTTKNKFKKERDDGYFNYAV